MAALSSKPESDLFTVTIDGLAYGGAGVGRREGKVVFVPGAYPGDTVLARAEKEKKRHTEAALVEVVSASPRRRTPACPKAADCGGCPWMPLDYGAQLEWKREILRDLIKRIGGVEADIAPVIPAENELGYRSRVRMRISASDGGAVIGYRRARSNDVVDVDFCPIASAPVNTILKEARRFFLENPEESRPFHEMEIETGMAGEPGRLTLRSKGRPPKGAGKRILDALDNVKCAVLRFGKMMEVYGDEALEMPTIDGKTLAFGPGVFSQVNHGQNLKLVETAMRMAGLSGGRQGLDLFCGMGNFSIPLAMKGAAMTGVETNARAVHDAEANRDRLGLLTASFSRGKAETSARRMLENGLGFDTVILDPPREAPPEIAGAAASLARERIVYVSCDPPSLARDIKNITESGFTVSAITPVDMFPQTFHAEVLCLMERVS